MTIHSIKHFDRRDGRFVLLVAYRVRDDCRGNEQLEELERASIT